MSDSTAIPRPMLVSPSILWAIGLTLLASLVFMYQGMDRVSTVLAQRAPDAVSIRYLELMLKMNPDDASMRMTLAKQHLQVGQLDQAASTLSPLVKDQPYDIQVLSLDLAIEQGRINALQPSDPNRALRIEGLIDRIREIQGKVREPQLLADLARISLAQNHPELAAEIYGNLKRVQPEQAVHWLRESARWFTAHGDTEKAGDTLDEAAQMAPDEATFQALANDALNAYVAAMAFDRALERAEAYRKRLSDDPAFLQHLIDIALAAGHPAQASKLGRELVELKPNDRDTLRRQIERELAVSDYRGAWVAANRLAKLDPSCVHCWERVAELADMSDQPQQALEIWLKMVRAGDQGKPLREAMRLAWKTRQDGLWIELMSSRMQSQILSKEDYFAAEAVYKRSRSPVEWVKFINKAIARNPNDILLWEGLVNALQKSGQSDTLISALEEMGRRFGNTKASVIRIAYLLTNLGKKDTALQKLRTVSSGMDATDTPFWELYGDLAWQLGSTDDAGKAYRTLVQGGTRQALVYERLARLSIRTGKVDAAIDYADQGWGLSGKPSLLILAMDAALKAKKWSKLDALLAAGVSHEAKLAHNEPYWTIKAKYEAHNGQINKAIASYERFVDANPNSVSARTGLLWLLIDHRQKPRLEKVLGRWQKGATADKALAEAFGAAFISLGRYHDALVYYENQQNGHTRDPKWLIQYAEVLRKTGKIEAASKLRGYVLRNFRTALAAEAKSDKQTALAYLDLVSEKEGAAERYIAFQMLATKD